MAQFGIHMCWYCCYVWSIHRSYLEFLDLAWSKLVLAFTSFDTKFTFSDMPDLLAPELQPPLPYHYFSESDSSNPEKRWWNIWMDVVLKYIMSISYLEITRLAAFLDPGEHTAWKLGKVVHRHLLVERLEQRVHEHLEHLQLCCQNISLHDFEQAKKTTWNFVSSATKFSGIWGALMWALTSCS